MTVARCLAETANLGPALQSPKGNWTIGTLY
jgi:hypothetical protein